MNKRVSQELFRSLSNNHAEYITVLHEPCIKNGLFELDKTKIIGSLYTKCDDMLTRLSTKLCVAGLDSSSF